MPASSTTLLATALVVALALALALALELAPERLTSAIQTLGITQHRGESGAPFSAAQAAVAAACEGSFAPYNASCPALLAIHYTGIAGFGHQFMEGVFAMDAARAAGLTYVHRPFNASVSHRESYAALNELFGIGPALEALGLPDLRAAMPLRVRQSPPRSQLRDPSGACGVVTTVSGYHWCTQNCFFAQENVGLFQRYAPCLRAATRAYGTVWRTCAFEQASNGSSGVNGSVAQAGEVVGDRQADRPPPAGRPPWRAPCGAVWCMHRSFASKAVAVPCHSALNCRPPTTPLPCATRAAPPAVRVAMHVRIGDTVLHGVNDTFYSTVLKGVRTITQGHRVELYVIGGARGGRQPPDEYVRAVRAAAAAAWVNVTAGEGVEVLAPALAVPDALRYMMQCDLLVGSGSSLPQVAALLSGKPLFLHHIPKHGFTSVELMADDADLDRTGKLLDSPRRLRVEFQRRVAARRPWDPCQARGGGPGRGGWRGRTVSNR